MDEEKALTQIDAGDFSYITHLVLENDLDTFAALMSYIYQSLDYDIVEYVDTVDRIRNHFRWLLAHSQIKSVHDIPDFVNAMDVFSTFEFVYELDDDSRENYFQKKEELLRLVDLYIDQYQSVVDEVIAEGYGDITDLPEPVRDVLNPYISLESDRPSHDEDYTSLPAFSIDPSRWELLIDYMQRDLTFDK